MGWTSKGYTIAQDELGQIEQVARRCSNNLYAVHWTYKAVSESI